MLKAVRTATNPALSDDQIAEMLMDRLPHDDEGAMFWA